MFRTVCHTVLLTLPSHPVLRSPLSLLLHSFIILVLSFLSLTLLFLFFSCSLLSSSFSFLPSSFPLSVSLLIPPLFLVSYSPYFVLSLSSSLSHVFSFLFLPSFFLPHTYTLPHTTISCSFYSDSLFHFRILFSLPHPSVPRSLSLTLPVLLHFSMSLSHSLPCHFSLSSQSKFFRLVKHVPYET